MLPKNNDMRFEVSTKCNYKCSICVHDTLTRKKEIMSLDLFKMLFDKIVNETDQYDTLAFPGMGEPLLDSTLSEKIVYAKERKPDLAVMILTNGSMLSVDKFLEFEALGVNSVRVSLYGSTPESYMKVHGITDPDIFYNVQANLEQIAKVKSKTQLLLTYNVVDGSNDDVVKDWIKQWEGKADLLEIWRPHNWGDAKDFRSVQGEMLATCSRPFSGPLQVQVDGTVNMCCFDYDGKLTLGDLKTQSLKEIFSSPIFEKLVMCHKAGDFKGSGFICECCDQRNADKSDVMVYNSKFDVKERVKMTSTTYSKLF